jgi:hypothetical protein
MGLKISAATQLQAHSSFGRSMICALSRVEMLAESWIEGTRIEVPVNEAPFRRVSRSDCSREKIGFGDARAFFSY